MFLNQSRHDKSLCSLSFFFSFTSRPFFRKCASVRVRPSAGDLPHRLNLVFYHRNCPSIPLASTN